MCLALQRSETASPRSSIAAPAHHENSRPRIGAVRAITIISVFFQTAGILMGLSITYLLVSHHQPLFPAKIFNNRNYPCHLNVRMELTDYLWPPGYTGLASVGLGAVSPERRLPHFRTTIAFNQISLPLKVSSPFVIHTSARFSLGSFSTSCEIVCLFISVKKRPISSIRSPFPSLKDI
jgi:hypothetical protein